MTTREDVERIETGMFRVFPEDEAEIESIEADTSWAEESDIIQGFDPLRYEDCDDFHDPYANQNLGI